MSLTEVYDVVQAAWTEGRLENVLQRQKELAHLHSVLTKSRPELMLASSEDFEQSGANTQQEIDLTLIAVQDLYDQLDFPSFLSKEKSIQTGHSSPLNPVALGPVLIQAALPCPISSAILPLAAAVAAGTCCLVLLCTETPAISKVLRTVIRHSLDYEAVGVLSEHLRPKDINSLYFESAVLQNPTTGPEFAIVLRQTNATVRIYNQAVGLPAIFVDRSIPSLELAVQWINKSIMGVLNRHSGRMPRVCLVDEFAIENFNVLMRQHDNSEKCGAPLPETTITKEIARQLRSLFSSLGNKQLSGKSDALLGLTVLQSNDPINPETIRQAAQLLTQSYEGILVIPTRSLDHSIDLWNKVNAGMSATSTYLFGGDKETAYLARFLKSDHCFINSIPSRSFGMIAPSSPRDTFTLPYHPEDFTTNKAILRDGGSIAPSQLLDLKKIKQTLGGQLSYFEQGLIVGLGLSAFAASGAIFAIYRVSKGYY